jgi:hypothetical protein
MDLQKEACVVVALVACSPLYGEEPTNNVCLAQPGKQDTNTTVSASPVFDLELGRQKTAGSLSDTYLEYIQKSGSVSAFDSVGWSSDPDWILRGEYNGYSVISEWNNEGESVIRRSFLNAGREMAAHSEVVEKWRNWDGLEGWFAWLFAGTVGNTAEEQLDPISPMATASQISWWQTRREDESMLFAPHFLDERPYLYQSSVWKNHSGKPILFEDIRLRYVPSDSMLVEEETIIPLTSSWQIVGGFSIDPIHLNGSRSDSRASASIDRIFALDESLSFGYVFDGSALWRFSFSKRF